MRFSTIESILPATLPARLPLRLEQQTSSVSAVMKLMVMIPVTLALLTPFLLLAQAVAADPAVRAAFQARSASLIQLGFGLAIWAVLFAWPLKRLLDGLAGRRSIEIQDGLVMITEKNLFRAKIWATPLGDYAGVIHHVRASLSGLRHELILAHDDRKSSVLLAIADRFTQAEIDRVSALLGHHQVPSASIYSLRVRRPGALASRIAGPYAQAA